MFVYFKVGTAPYEKMMVGSSPLLRSILVCFQQQFIDFWKGRAVCANVNEASNCNKGYNNNYFCATLRGVGKALFLQSLPLISRPDGKETFYGIKNTFLLSIECLFV